MEKMDEKHCIRDIQNDSNILEKVIDPEDFIQRMGSLLTNKQTRCSGINILNQTLNYLSITMLERKANLWITLSFKAYAANEFSDSGALFFHLLEKFIFRMQESTNLYKSFENNHLRKLYDVLSTSSKISLKYAISCLETSLRIYPVTDTSSKDLIDNILNKLITTTDNELSMSVGKCKQLLCVSRGNQEQNANQWQKYQQNLLESLFGALDDMFSKCSEIGSLKNYQYKNVNESNTPIQLTSKYIRFHNLINYMITALREPFPVMKHIKPKSILNFIHRGLSVNHLILEQNPIAENIELGLLLHKLHLDILNLLSALLITCRSHLKQHFQEILDLLTATLKGLSKVKEDKKLNENENSVKTALLILRSKIYDTISFCLTILQVGCLVPSIMDSLVNEIFKDITPLEKTFIFEVSNNTTKNAKKKSMNKMSNKHSHLARFYTNSNNMKGTKRHFRDGYVEVCVSALRCLEALFEKSVNFLKPSLIKLVQTNITRICCQLYQYRPINRTIDYLYDDEICRLQLLKTLHKTYVTAHYLDVEFAEVTVKILQTSQCNDGIFNVRNWCSDSLQIFEKIQHPQKESLLTPPDYWPFSKNSTQFPAKGNYLFNQFLQNSCSDLTTNVNLCQNILSDNNNINNTSDECMMDETIIDDKEMNEGNSQTKFSDEKDEEQNFFNMRMKDNGLLAEKIESEQPLSDKDDSNTKGQRSGPVVFEIANVPNVSISIGERKDKHESQVKNKEKVYHENDKDENGIENSQISKKLKLTDDATYSDIMEANDHHESNSKNLLSEMLNLFVDELK